MRVERLLMRTLTLSAAFTPFILASCLMDINTDDKKKDKEAAENGFFADDPNALPPEMRNARLCTQSEAQRRSMQQNYTCFTDEANTWRANCQGTNCQELHFFVHYMLMDNLGSSTGVNVEAFDNEHFAGNPVATSRVSGLDASHPGSFKDGKLYLAPGQYYVRAYISNDDTTSVPYAYQGLQVVSDHPVGVAGALSHPATVTIPSDYRAAVIEPLTIYLDQLFKKPASENPSQATLRVLLSSGTDVAVKDSREIRIRLYADQDFAKKPVKEYVLSSSNLLVEGRKGQTEMIQPSAPVGIFYVQAFIDDNQNGYLDSNEPSAVYSQDGQMKTLDVQENRTATVSLNLTTATQAVAVTHQ